MRINTTECNIYNINYSMSAKYRKFLASFCSGAGTNAFSAQRHWLRLLVIFMVDGQVYEQVHVIMKRVSDRP